MKISLTKVGLILALTNVVDSNGTFKRQATWPLVADDPPTIFKSRSKVECASHLSTGGVGFVFNKRKSTCHLLHCISLNVTDDSVNLSSLQLYLEHPLVADYTLARGKLANMSTTHSSPLDAGKAVDGIYLPDGGEMSSLAHSQSSDNGPWWRVDLEQLYCIWGVNILNRAYAEPQDRDRNKDVDVTVSRDETQLMYGINPDSRCNYFDGPLNEYYTLITCIQPMRGQFVQLQYRPNNGAIINLYEIEVFGV